MYSLHSMTGGDVHVGRSLLEMFPGLRAVKFPDGCPRRESGCYCVSVLPPNSGWVDLADVIMHLNDNHKWPRTEKDRTEENKDKPTIYGWLKEESEKNGWDLNVAYHNTD